MKVQVGNSWVTLTGEVDWHYQKAAAAQQLRHLWSITGLSNQVTLTPRVDVADLGDSITHALHRSWFCASKTITVSAEGGQVRLTGAVRLPHDRQFAAATTWSAAGVTGVQNDIDVI